jgi:hypothetical protein
MPPTSSIWHTPVYCDKHKHFKHLIACLYNCPPGRRHKCKNYKPYKETVKEAIACNDEHLKYYEDIHGPAPKA